MRRLLLCDKSHNKLLQVASCIMLATFTPGRHSSQPIVNAVLTVASHVVWKERKLERNSGECSILFPGKLRYPLKFMQQVA